MNDQGKQHHLVRRTQYLINKGFQLRYMGVFVGASLLAAGVIGGLLFYLVEVNWILQLDRGLSLFPEVKELLKAQRLWVVMTAGSGFLVFAGMLSIWGLFLSHRVAGPVFALSRRMNKIVLEHDLVSPLFLRKKDSLQEVKDFFNITLEVIRNRMHDEIGYWDQLLQKFSDPQFKEVYQRIEVLKRDKEKWVIVHRS